MAVRCQIVDDNDHFVRAARVLLEREGCDIVAVASTGSAAVRQARELGPDLALVDIDLGGESGFDLANRVVDAYGPGRPQVILVSGHHESDFAELIADSPALAFLPKSDLSGVAIRHVLAQSQARPAAG